MSSPLGVMPSLTVEPTKKPCGRLCACISVNILLFAHLSYLPSEVWHACAPNACNLRQKTVVDGRFSRTSRAISESEPFFRVLELEAVVRIRDLVPVTVPVTCDSGGFPAGHLSAWWIRSMTF